MLLCCQYVALYSVDSSVILGDEFETILKEEIMDQVRYMPDIFLESHHKLWSARSVYLPLERLYSGLQLRRPAQRHVWSYSHRLQLVTIKKCHYGSAGTCMPFLRVILFTADSNGCQTGNKSRTSIHARLPCFLCSIAVINEAVRVRC